MTFQQCIAVGNVGRDPEFKYTPQGIAVCSFSLAVNRVTGRGENRKDETTWFNVTIWRERAETASQLIRKGSKIMVIGEVKARAYTDKNGQPAASLDLTANEFKLLDSRGQGTGEYEGAPRSGGASNSGGDYAESADDIPF
jgi:single-strand DNA-binding protein